MVNLRKPVSLVKGETARHPELRELVKSWRDDEAKASRAFRVLFGVTTIDYSKS